MCAKKEGRGSVPLALYVRQDFTLYARPISANNRAASRISAGLASSRSMTRKRAFRTVLIASRCSSHSRAWASLLRSLVARAFLWASSMLFTTYLSGQILHGLAGVLQGVSDKVKRPHVQP